jgi:hypothetical protein
MDVRRRQQATIGRSARLSESELAVNTQRVFGDPRKVAKNGVTLGSWCLAPQQIVSAFPSRAAGTLAGADAPLATLGPVRGSRFQRSVPSQ